MEEIKQRTQKIAGQVQGIDRMIEEGRSCQDIIQQVIAVRSALASLGIEVIVNESTICKNEADRTTPQHMAELMKSLFKIT